MILIVEDVVEMREFLKVLLEPFFDRVLTAADTASARAQLTRERPELILLDEFLPGESGLDLLPELQGIPVMLLTSMEDRDVPVPAGASARVRKPDFEKRGSEAELLKAIKPWSSG